MWQKEVQIPGPLPVVSHTLMHTPNHEILTILAEVRTPPPPTLPKLQIFVSLWETTNQPTHPPSPPKKNQPTKRASFTEKKVFYPNLVNAQLTQSKEEKALTTYHWAIWDVQLQKNSKASHLLSWEKTSYNPGNTPSPFFKPKISLLGANLDRCYEGREWLWLFVKSKISYFLVCYKFPVTPSQVI